MPMFEIVFVKRYCIDVIAKDEDDAEERFEEIEDGAKFSIKNLVDELQIESIKEL